MGSRMRPNVIDKIMNNSREIELKNGKILCYILGGCECANNVVNKGQKSLALSSRYTLKAVVVFFFTRTVLVTVFSCQRQEGVRLAVTID